MEQVKDLEREGKLSEAKERLTDLIATAGPNNPLRRKAVDRYPPEFPNEGPAFGQLLEYLRECRR